MVIYFILAIIVTLITIYSIRFNEKSQKILYVLTAILMTLIIIVRDSTVNKDYGIYKQLYDKAPTLSVLKNSFSEYNDKLITEASYSMLCTVLKETENSDKTNFIIIFAIYAIIGVAIKTIAIRRTSDLPFLALFTYFCNIYLLQEMTQVRAGIALGFVLLSIKDLYDRKYWLFFLWIFIAAFFHTSAFMALILIFFREIKADRRVWGTIFLICVIINITQFDILNLIKIIPFEFYQYKLKAYILLQDRADFKINYFNISFILQNVIIIICFFYKKLLEEKCQYVNILLNMCCLSSCCFVFFGQIPGFAFRISELFNISLIFLIPQLAKVMTPKYIGQLIVISIGWILFLINVLHSGLLQPYKTFWS